MKKKNAVLSLCSDPAIKDEQNRNVRNHCEPSSNSNSKKWNRETDFTRLIHQPLISMRLWSLNLTDSFSSVFWFAKVQSILSRLYSQEAPPRNSPVAQCKILARSIQSGQKHQTLHGCSLGHVSQYQDRCPQLPLQDLQQLLAEVLQQPSMMGALC